MGIVLRDANRNDCDFVYNVRKEAFKEYVEINGTWKETEQLQLHEKRFSKLDFQVIQKAGVDVGILATSNTVDHLFLNQLFIMPQFQNKGIGREVMKQVIGNAKKAQLPLRLAVLKVNLRASAFYMRLGFKKSKENDDHIFYEILP